MSPEQLKDVCNEILGCNPNALIVLDVVYVRTLDPDDCKANDGNQFKEAAKQVAIKTGCVGVPVKMGSGGYIRFSVGCIREPKFARYLDSSLNLEQRTIGDAVSGLVGRVKTKAGKILLKGLANKLSGR